MPIPQIEDHPEDDRDQIVVDLRRARGSSAFIDGSAPGDRPRLRREEFARLQKLEAAVRAEGALSPFGFDRRLALVRQLRTQLANVPAPDDADEHVATTTCGRCRQTFESDPDLPPSTPSTFWLCPRCRAILLPGR